MGESSPHDPFEPVVAGGSNVGVQEQLEGVDAARDALAAQAPKQTLPIQLNGDGEEGHDCSRERSYGVFSRHCAGDDVRRRVWESQRENRGFPSPVS